MKTYSSSQQDAVTFSGIVFGLLWPSAFESSLISFLTGQRPRSVNAHFAARYKEGLESALRKYYPTPPQLIGPLYGVVYHFYSRHSQLDADNLSKPIWDALEGVLYEDDRAIEFRQAGILDVSKGGLQAIDLTKLPDNVANEFHEMIGQAEHTLYIEIGPLDRSVMFRFQVATQGGLVARQASGRDALPLPPDSRSGSVSE